MTGAAYTVFPEFEVTASPVPRARRLRVLGLDAVDGSPVLDIKPVVAEFLPQGPVRQPDWSRGMSSETRCRALGKRQLS
jgi:tRNA (Thr-GGU) A37 N-methylase